MSCKFLDSTTRPFKLIKLYAISHVPAGSESLLSREVYRVLRVRVSHPLFVSAAQKLGNSLRFAAEN